MRIHQNGPQLVGSRVESGPIECGERGHTGLCLLKNGPSWIIPIGGGWSNRHATNSLWADMNVHAALALTANPNRIPVKYYENGL